MEYCWPELLKTSRFLQEADVLIFSNNVTQVNSTTLSLVQQLFSNNPSFWFEFAPESSLRDIEYGPIQRPWIGSVQANRFQYGANEAVRLGFVNNWFANYSWVIRINPDVLILNSTWIAQMMTQSEVDGIFVRCDKKKIHTDFFAVRPTACTPSAWDEMELGEVERGKKALWSIMN